LLQKSVRVVLAVGLAVGFLLTAFQQVRADGPSIPSYIIQDGKHVPAPTGYVQTSAFGGEAQSIGPFKTPMDLFRDPATDNLVVADTGNNRVVVLDKQGRFLLEIGGEKAGLNDPEGVFVDQYGSIWVADKGNKRVVVFNPDGSFKAAHTKPDSIYLAGVNFSPSKLVVDKRGFIYVVTGSENNLGVVVIDSTERFRGFFGRTRIQFDLKRLIAHLIATDAQRKKMLLIAAAPLGNLYLDPLGFIYAISPVMKVDQIQRLNSVGTNVYGDVGTRTGAGKLWDKLTGKEGIVFGETGTQWGWNDAMRMNVPEGLLPQFLDLAVDDLGIVSVIDGRNSQIYQYDQSGNLLTIFGGKGMSAGFFQQPVSIAAGEEGILYILDSGRGDIQVFRPTELTLMIHQASYEYFNGDYQNAAQLWGEISQRNTNFALAHAGLGKTLMGQKCYLEAMQEYYYAEAKEGYSAAFNEYRYVWMRDHFGWLGLGVIGAIVAVGFTWNRIITGFRNLVERIQNMPGRMGLLVVPVLLVLTILSWMTSLSALSFHFTVQRPDEIRLLFESGKILIPWLTWCVSAFGVGEIFFGEGTFRKIVIASAWALWPLIVLPLPVNLLTQVITLDERAIYDILWAVIWVLLAWQMLMVLKNVHNFDFGQALPLMGLVLLGMVFIWILCGLVYALTAEIFRFIGQLIMEIYVRMY